MNEYVGIPFVDGGRDRDGCDCWGLLKLYMREQFDIELPDFDISAFDTDSVIQEMESGRKGPQWIEVTRDEYQRGDVIAMAIGIRRLDMVNHVGVYLGGDRFLHITKNTDSMINRLTDLMWASRIIGVYRWAN